MNTPEQYRPDIDGLRALAVLLVLVFHFRLAGDTGGAGFLGVDVFFVISGYLISRILNRQLEHGSFSWRGFYLSRIRRLTPALVVTVAGCAIWGWWSALPLDFEELTRQLGLSQLYVANLYFWQRVNYFGLGVERTPMLHIWSLAVEEQFYLLFPGLLVLVHRRRPTSLTKVLAATLIASFTLNLLLVQSKPSLTFYLLPTRGWELLAGALLAQCPPSKWQRGVRADALGLAGLGLIAMAVLAYSPAYAVPGWWATLPVLGAAALIHAGGEGQGIAARCLARRSLVYLGRISYPAYLIHWPVHVFMMHENSALNWPGRASAFLLSLGMAALVFHCVEQPVRLRRLLSTTRQLLGAYGAFLIAILTLWAISSSTGGIPQRWPPKAVALASHAQDRSPPLLACQFKQGQAVHDSAPCVMGDPQLQPSWLLVGDSHAWALSEALDGWMRQRHESAVLYFRHACPPLFGVHLVGDGGACTAFHQQAQAYLGSHPQIHSVLLISTWLQAAEGLLSSTPNGAPDQARSLEAFRRGMHQTLSSLQNSGRRVVIWEPLPGARESVPEAMALSALARRREIELRWTEQEYNVRYAFFFDALAAFPGAQPSRIAPASVLCHGGWCDVSRDGVPIYFDNGHVTRSSAPLWADLLGQTLK